MKRQTQKLGIRKFFGDDLLELQSEGFKVLDGFFGEYGEAIIAGCSITPAENEVFNISSGIVALSVMDMETEITSIKVMPFEAVNGVTLPAYITTEITEETTVSRVYADSISKPVAYDYKAIYNNLEPITSYIEISQNNTLRFVDAIQDEKHSFITAIERVKWNAILASAKQYSDDRETVIIESVEAKDATVLSEAISSAETKDIARLAQAKEYADTIVAGLVDSSPESLDTLHELATALGDDPNFATTMLNALAGKSNNGHKHDTVGGIGLNGLLPKTAWHCNNGCLIKLNIKKTEQMLCIVEIIGNGYGEKPINTIIQFYNCIQTSDIMNAKVTHYGLDLGNINIFYYQEYVYMWLKETSDFQTFNINATIKHPYSSIIKKGNAVLEITNVAMPTEGVLKLVTLTPTGANCNWSEINNKPTTFTPASHTHLASAITEDSGHKFVTDREKAAWSGKAEREHGHIASAIEQSANNRFVTDNEKTAWSGKAEGGHRHSYGEITDKPRVICGSVSASGDSNSTVFDSKVVSGNIVITHNLKSYDYVITATIVSSSHLHGDNNITITNKGWTTATIRIETTNGDIERTPFDFIIMEY